MYGQQINGYQRVGGRGKGSDRWDKVGQMCGTLKNFKKLKKKKDEECLKYNV